MPLTVRAWPDSTDPRGGLFSVIGYAWGQVPPNQWLLTTTGALAPYEVFNDGVLVTAIDFGEQTTQHTNIAATTILLKDGTIEPIGPPPLFTVSMQLNTLIFPGPLQVGLATAEFPNAIRTWEITMENFGGGGTKFPNPVLMTPKNHLFTL